MHSQTGAFSRVISWSRTSTRNLQEDSKQHFSPSVLTEQSGHRTNNGKRFHGTLEMHSGLREMLDEKQGQEYDFAQLTGG
jgi:hypothetical protein